MNSSDSIDAAKQALRKRMDVQRRGLSMKDRAAGASAVADTGLEFIDLAPGAVVSGYVAIRDELDPEQLLRSLSAKGHPIALPVILGRGRPLEFCQWEAGGELVPGEFSVPIPGANAPILVPDVLLTPLLAFDSQGYRLGYGAGYYDRTLAKLRRGRAVTAIGMAFDIQEVENLPHDGYDEPLDWVLTPSGPRKMER